MQLLNNGVVLSQVMLELAQLYLNLDEVDACQQQCSAILKRDKFNEEATLVCFFFLVFFAILA